ncbi:MAG: hypothetical protein KAT37_00505 [Candidatus Aenigmarchaeota archaeon]|nr:hypothetical protein [Candidatus Aenigmarchaeota archaeon]
MNNKEQSQKSWLDLPNLLGDRETLEDLCKTDVGRNLAAMGTIGAALNSINEEKNKPANPRFLRPSVGQFPFDKTTLYIIRALEERNFDVPGINVKFHYYGPSDSYKKVDTIEGDDFRLWFCRVQGKVDPFWNDTAAVTELNIPRKELHVYEDNSGPTFYLYAGDDWEKDKKLFTRGLKVNSKLNKEPKTYLRYTGSLQKSHLESYLSKPFNWAPYLVHDNDLGREYDPEGDEPAYFKTQKVFQEFKDFLESKLKEIEKE